MEAILETLNLEPNREVFFNFCVEHYYKQDLEILQQANIFKKEIICYVYNAHNDEVAKRNTKIISNHLRTYLIRFKVREDCKSEPDFIEQFNDKQNIAILVVTRHLIAHKDDLIHRIWTKVTRLVPFELEKDINIAKELHSTLGSVTSIRGTTKYLHEKIWNIVEYLYKEDNDYDKALSNCSHKQQIRDTLELLQSREANHSAMINELMDYYQSYLRTKSENVLSNLFSQIKICINKKTMVSSKNPPLLPPYYNPTYVPDPIRREVKTDLPMTRDDLFNFCKSQYYEQDISLLIKDNVFNYPIVCFLYHISDNEGEIADIKELIHILGNYKIYFKFKENFYNEAEFVEQLNKSYNLAIILINETFITCQTAFIHSVQEKASKGHLVPLLLKATFKDKLHTTLRDTKLIDGTSSCFFEKIWNIIDYLYNNDNNYVQTYKRVTHQTKITTLSQFLGAPSNSALINDLLKRYSFSQSHKLQELLSEIENLILNSNTTDDTEIKPTKQSCVVNTASGFAIGKSDFIAIMESKGRFVDKSLFIKEIIDDKTQVKLILRPQQFGKTLNMSMLKTFFEKSKVNNSFYFEHLKIWQVGEYYRQQQGQYPVLFITLKDIKSSTFEEACDEFKELVAAIYDDYREILFSGILKDDSDAQASYREIIHKKVNLGGVQKALQRLAQYLHRQYGKPTIVLIDEYDTPMQASYIHGYYSKMAEFMCSFLSPILKDNRNVYQAVLTGIFQLLQEVIRLGLSNVRSYTVLSEAYSQYFGFTIEEIKELLDRMATEDLLLKIKDWYGGYQIGPYNLFNPWSIINFIQDNHARIQRLVQPRFQGYCTSISENELIMKLIHKMDKEFKNNCKMLMQNQLAKQKVDCHIVLTEINKNYDSFYSFLLVSGYLTINEKDGQTEQSCYALVIPNQELHLFYEKLARDWFGEEAFNSPYIKKDKDLSKPIKKENIPKTMSMTTFDTSKEAYIDTPAIFKSNNKTSIDSSLESNTSTKRDSLHDVDKVKTLLKNHSHIPADFQLGTAIGKGDCFFDAMAQGLNQLTGKQECGVKSLRLFCDSYAKTPGHTWVKATILKDKDNYEQYLTRIAFTVEEMALADWNIRKDPAVWGRPHIEGRMICEQYNIQLHVIEVLENEDESTYVMEQLVTKLGSRSIELMAEDAYTDARILHLVVYRNHFVPILPKATYNVELKPESTQFNEHSLKKSTLSVPIEKEISEYSKFFGLPNTKDTQEADQIVLLSRRKTV